MAIDMPPSLPERVVCSISAAVKYEVPANVVLAVAEKEAGKPGQWVRNSNGTYDVGPLQFNTSYLAELAKYGITSADVAASGCYSYDLAAWRLRGHIRDDRGDLWTKAANYHSRTPQFNSIYRADLIRRAVKWADWLEARYATRSLSGVATPPSTSASASAAPAYAYAVAPATTGVRSAAPASIAPAYVPRSIVFNDAK